MSAITSLDDIEFDLAGSRRAASRAYRSAASGEMPLPANPRPGSGARLMAGCDAANLSRYRGLLLFESVFPKDGDHGQLIILACQVFESILEQILAAPAHELGEPLLAGMKSKRKNRKQVEILEKWLAGVVPTTIGVHSLLLLALRRGLESEVSIVQDFIAARFQEGYSAKLLSKGLGRAIDRLRQEFRNPACHGFGGPFTPQGYRDFVRLLVAQSELRVWDEAGPERFPEAEEGLLHHHLADRQRDAGASPSEAVGLGGLLRVIAAAPSSWRLRVRPHRVEESRPLGRLRDIAIGAPPRPRFRLGESIRFAVQSEVAAHVILIDVGTSGRASVVLPNAWRSVLRLEPGALCYLPDLEFPEFELNLSGAPGEERVIALACREPLPLDLMPRGSDAFLALGEAELGRLVGALETLDASHWSAAQCAFSVVA